MHYAQRAIEIVAIVVDETGKIRPKAILMKLN